MERIYNPSEQPLYTPRNIPLGHGKSLSLRLPRLARPAIRSQVKHDHTSIQRSQPEDQSTHTPPMSPENATPADKHQTRAELKQAIGDAGEVLAKAKTVWPFTLFPDTITLDRSNLTITHKAFFRVGEVTTIRVQDILNTIAVMGPFFASLKITTRFFGEDKIYEIHYLPREDALKVKRILQGYIIALQKDIDCSSLSTKELAKLLDELGSKVT